jgi:hypothetical protein
MATTAVEYKGQFVLVPESVLICVGHMLFYEAWLNTNDSAEKMRFEQMRQDFIARDIGVGCTDLGLDQLLHRDKEKEEEFLSFVKLARNRLASFPDKIPPEYVDKVFVAGMSEYKGHSIIKPWFHKILNVIEYLIQGRPVDPNFLFRHVVQKSPD